MGSAMGAPGQVAEFLFDHMSMSHRFRVIIDDPDYDLGTWSKVGGLSVSWTPHHYRCGENNDDHVLPGMRKYANIKLSRAACSDSAIVQKWLVKTTTNYTPLCGVIMMIDFVGMPVVSWELKKFYPISWSISEFDSGSAKTAIETLELAHTGFLHDEVKAGSGG